MAKLLLAKEVTASMSEVLRARAEALKEKGVTPCLAIVRCGGNPSDLSYERGAIRRAAEIGVEVRPVVLPETVGKDALIETLQALNADETVHGVLLFRPLPAHLKADSDEICNALVPEKDVDGMTDLSYAGVYSGKRLGFAPCTAQACTEILDHYGIPCQGKNAVVIGRSLVIGKPVAMLLTARNATVTVCHTKTVGTAEIAKRADLLITAAGSLRSLTREFVRPGQTVLDVSMNWDAEKVTAKGVGGMSGDAVFEEVEPIVDAITPVPGGVGGVTSTVLIAHTIEAAERTLK